MNPFAVETDNGKYKFINNNGVVNIYRHGELWDTGNKATLSLLYKIEEDQELINKYEQMLGVKE